MLAGRRTWTAALPQRRGSSGENPYSASHDKSVLLIRIAKTGGSGLAVKFEHVTNATEVLDVSPCERFQWFSTLPCLVPTELHTSWIFGASQAPTSSRSNPVPGHPTNCGLMPRVVAGRALPARPSWPWALMRMALRGATRSQLVFPAAWRLSDEGHVAALQPAQSWHFCDEGQPGP